MFIGAIQLQVLESSLGRDISVKVTRPCFESSMFVLPVLRLKALILERTHLDGPREIEKKPVLQLSVSVLKYVQHRTAGNIAGTNQHRNR